MRQLVFGSGAVRSLGQYARRFVVPGSDLPPTWSALLGSGSAFLTIPIGSGQVYCYCDGPLDDPTSLRDLLEGYAEPVPILLDALDTMALEDAMVLAKSFTAAAGIAARGQRNSSDVAGHEPTGSASKPIAATVPATSPPPIRGLMLRRFGKRILHSNFRPLREQP